MSDKNLNKIFALIVFLISITVLFRTTQPSVSFWDCGEFIAASYYLQVPHPPGAPFFLLIGRIFSMIPFADNIGFRVNMISILSSALSVMLLYLIIVKLIENYRGKEYKNLLDRFTTYFAAAIGALSFSFSDTFWFNGVEAEVYAASTFLFALITYLIMRWNERADSKDNEKYILVIAYLIGLSTAVHLMSLLAMISVVMIIMFRKYVDNDAMLKKSSYILLGHIALLLIIAIALWTGQDTQNIPTPEEYKDFDNRFIMIFAGVSILIIGAFWKKVFNRNSIYMPIIIGSVALMVAYPGVVKIVPGLMTSLGGNNINIEILILLILIGIFSYGIYYSVKKNKPTLNLIVLSFAFILLGFTTYSMVIIRSNQEPPMNENEPNDFTELVSYLNREQYGDFPIFKRRFATEPHQQVVYINYSSDLDFWWRYQMNHMYTRYWMWNYAGRTSWYQEDGVNVWPFNSISNALFGKILNINFSGKAKDSLYGIPFLLGLLGIYFHFKKDWKMASAYLVLFIFMGFLTAFYQNQQQPQPRERDYFYVGAFFVFSIWIGIAVKSIADYVQIKIKRDSFSNAAVVGVIALGIIFVPVKMITTNYFTHDRSRNWVPWDYSYNMLQSCAPNAILFTNGDNDTFPLWYLQDVEGVRRDVRIANLSLINTPWYVRQLKYTEPYGTPKVKIRIPDEQIENLMPIQWEPRMITVPVPPDVYKEFGIVDTSITKEGKISWLMNNTVTYGNIKAIRNQDILVREIIEANNWERPIYFAMTTSEESKIGLQDYLKVEGMSLRLVPEKRKQNEEFVNEKVLREQLFNENPSYSKTYKPGFKYRGLNDTTIFFDENHERMIANYRNAFIRLAIHYLNDNNDKENTIATLDLMERKISRKIFPVDPRLLFDIANIYYTAGAFDRYKVLAKEIESYALNQLEVNPTEVSSYYNPYRLLLETYENLKQYDKALGILNRLQSYYPNDPTIKNQIQRYKDLISPKDTVKIDSVQKNVP